MLSVIIITYNEENKIRDCLESVKWADEIVVVDSFSTDNTLSICKEYTPNVIQRKWEGFASQKDFALKQASNNWILSIDADERVTPELKEEIISICQSTQNADGYKIPRRNHLIGKWIKSCFWYPDYQLRLFQKDKVEMNFVSVHEGFIIKGKEGICKGDLIHYTFDNLHDAFSKINTYSSLAAKDRFEKKRIRAIDFIFHPLAAFLTDFISRKGYKDGVYGLIVSLINAITNLMMYMKMWELQRGKKI